MAKVEKETGEYLSCFMIYFADPPKNKLLGIYAEVRYWLARFFRRLRLQ